MRWYTAVTAAAARSSASPRAHHRRARARVPGQQQLEQHPGGERVARDRPSHQRQQHTVGVGRVRRPARSARRRRATAAPPAASQTSRRRRRAPRSALSRRHSSSSRSNTLLIGCLPISGLGAADDGGRRSPGMSPALVSARGPRRRGGVAPGGDLPSPAGRAPPYDGGTRPAAGDDRDEDAHADGGRGADGAAGGGRRGGGRRGDPLDRRARRGPAACGGSARLAAAGAAAGVAATDAPVPVGSAIVGAGLAAAAVIDARRGPRPGPRRLRHGRRSPAGRWWPTPCCRGTSAARCGRPP